MRRLTQSGPLAYLLYPGLLGLSLLGAWALYRATGREAWSVSLPVVIAYLVVMALERVRPYDPTMKESGKVVLRDMAHSLLWHGAMPALFRATFLGAAVITGHMLRDAVSLPTLWPTFLPLPLGALLALFIGEFFAYMIHRFGHETELGWRIHSLHHSMEKLHALAGGRNHPFNVAPSYLAQLTPLFVLGAPTEVLILHAVFTGVNGALQHCNLFMRTGVLGYVFAVPQLHFWHHSDIPEESNHNYGSNVLIWDLLFGTWQNPGADVMPDRMGLLQRAPDTFVDQLLWPFTQKARASAEQALVTDKAA